MPKPREGVVVVRGEVGLLVGTEEIVMGVRSGT